MADQHNPGEHQEPLDPHFYGQGQPQGVPPQGVPQQPDGTQGRPGAAASAETAIGFWKGLRKAAENAINKVRGKEEEEAPASIANTQAQPHAASHPAAPADARGTSGDMENARKSVREKFSDGKDKLFTFASEKNTAFGAMDWTNKSTAIGGAALAVEGGVNTARNLKDGKIGRAFLSGARCVLGAVMTYGTFEAKKAGDKNVLVWGQRILQERVNRGPNQQGV